MSNILFKKHLALLTHFDIYKSEPRRDCNSFLVHFVLLCHILHIFCMFFNLSCGTDTVKSSVFISTPRQMAFVHDLTNFLMLMPKPNIRNNSNNVSKDGYAVVTVPKPMTSSM